MQVLSHEVLIQPSSAPGMHSICFIVLPGTNSLAEHRHEGSLLHGANLRCDAKRRSVVSPSGINTAPFDNHSVEITTSEAMAPLVSDNTPAPSRSTS